MNANEKKLFETYKEIEQTLSEKFSGIDFGGVSEYIERLKAHHEEAAGIIPGWDEWEARLVTLRAKRNVIAHENRGSGTSEEDVAWLKEMLELIKADGDPLQRYYLEKGYLVIREEDDVVDIEHIQGVKNTSWAKWLLAGAVIILMVVAGIWWYMRK